MIGLWELLNAVSTSINILWNLHWSHLKKIPNQNATQLKGVVDDASARPPNLSLAHVTLTFDFLHSICWYLMGIYCNIICLPCLVKICGTNFEISHQRGCLLPVFGLIWCKPLTSWLPMLIIPCPCPVDHLCQLASKLVYSFSEYRICKLLTYCKRMNGRTDRPCWEHNASNH